MAEVFYRSVTAALFFISAGIDSFIIYAGNINSLKESTVEK
jgi:hypothetical protein